MKVIINKKLKVMDEVMCSTKEINPNHYMEIGIDENYPVLYVYKDGKLFDWHFSSGTSFSAEMWNTIECYKITHGHEPSFKDITFFRTWFKALKDKNYI